MAPNRDEQERIVADLGTASLMQLRNHGTLALGRTPGLAWSAIYPLESACTAQVRTLSAGRDGVPIAPPEAQDEVRRQLTRERAPVEGRKPHGALVWEAALRKAHRDAPGFNS